MNFQNQLNSSSPQQETAWSPFSTPSFSPYDKSSISFQYSSNIMPEQRTTAKSSNVVGFKDPILNEITFKLNSASNVFPYQQQSIAHHNISRKQQVFNDELDLFLSSISNRSLINKINSMQSAPELLNSLSNSSSVNTNLPKRSETIDMTEYIRVAAIQRSMGGRVKLCTFCKTNGEHESIYTSHSLKDSNDKITCPILLRYACPVCGATGEKTHTKKYCPVLQKKMRLDMLNKMASQVASYQHKKRESSSSPTSSSSNSSIC